MWNNSKPLLLLLLIISTSIAGVAAKKKNGGASIVNQLFYKVFSSVAEEDDDDCGLIDALPYIVAGAGLTAFAAPAALTALGFTGTGIAANTAAAWLMKISAIANGGGVPAGGIVATLQSLGTSSFSYLTGGAAGHTFHKHFICGKKESSKGKK